MDAGGIALSIGDYVSARLGGQRGRVRGWLRIHPREWSVRPNGGDPVLSLQLVDEEGGLWGGIGSTVQRMARQQVPPLAVQRLIESTMGLVEAPDDTRPRVDLTALIAQVED